MVAIIAAAAIWFLVDHSIMVTRTIPNIPVRVLNLPKDKTIEGLLPNGLLSERLALTITGKRTTIDKLTGNDIEVTTDATGMGDRWTIEVTKRNLVATNPDINIAQDITSVLPLDLTIQLSPLITEKISITITEPIGEPPKGYRLLDIWPQHLYQKVSGPAHLVRELKARGLKLTFNLSQVTAEELDKLQEEAKDKEEDEIRFFIPGAWKRVRIPFAREEWEEINDPEAAYLHIDFLKQDLLPIDEELPVALFFPLDYSLTLNPETYTLEKGPLVGSKNGIDILTEPLYVRNVSRLFLETVRDSLQITFRVLPKDVSETLPWSIQFIDPKGLEESYIKRSLAAAATEEEDDLLPQMRTSQLRERFRNYMREFTLLHKNQSPLQLHATLDTDTITVTEKP